MCEISYYLIYLGASEVAPSVGITKELLGLVALMGNWFFVVLGLALIVVIAVGIKISKGRRERRANAAVLEGDCQRAGERSLARDEVGDHSQEQGGCPTSVKSERQSPEIIESMRRLVSEPPEGAIKEYLEDLTNQIDSDTSDGEGGCNFLLSLADSCGDIDLITAGEGKAYEGGAGEI